MPPRKKPTLSLRKPPPAEPPAAVVESFVSRGTHAGKARAAELPPELADRLGRRCAELSISVDDALREAVLDWIERPLAPEDYRW